MNVERVIAEKDGIIRRYPYRRMSFARVGRPRYPKDEGRRRL
jgi:hypothetical protein